MIASAVIQTALLLTSGAFNVALNPGSLSVGKQLFVSSVILMIGFAQGLTLLFFKVLIRLITGWSIRFGSGYLFAPLASAMSNSVNDRPGETDVNTPVVTQTHPRMAPDQTKASVYDGYDTDDEDQDIVASHFMPELEVAIDERRNVYTDIYLLGIATFTTTYCIDTVSPVPTTAFLSGLLVMSIAQSANIIAILFRSTNGYFDGELANAMRGKRMLTVTSCVFATSSFCMFCAGLSHAKVQTSTVSSLFDVIFSVILPLITPWLLVTVSPKQQPLRTFFECTPFVFTICCSFVLFFLATRGEMTTLVHDLSNAGVAIGPNGTSTKQVLSNNVIEIEFHSDVNASLQFNMDLFSTTSVDSAGNIPMLLAAPLVKIPTIIVVLANVINRSNLVVITALLVTMSLREICDPSVDLSTRHAYMVSFVLATISLLFNVIKYLRIPPWVLALRMPKKSPKNFDSGDMNLEQI